MKYNLNQVSDKSMQSQLDSRLQDHLHILLHGRPNHVIILEKKQISKSSRINLIKGCYKGEYLFLLVLVLYYHY